MGGATAYKPCRPFQGYIASQGNGYQSLHTTLLSNIGRRSISRYGRTPCTPSRRASDAHGYQGARRRTGRKVAAPGGDVLRRCAHPDETRAPTVPRQSRSLSFPTPSTCSRRSRRSWRPRAAPRGRLRHASTTKGRPPSRLQINVESDAAAKEMRSGLRSRSSGAPNARPPRHDEFVSTGRRARASAT